MFNIKHIFVIKHTFSFYKDNEDKHKKLFSNDDFIEIIKTTIKQTWFNVNEQIITTVFSCAVLELIKN